MRKSSRGCPYHDEEGKFCSADRAKTIWCGEQKIDVSDMTVSERERIAEELENNPETAKYYDKSSKCRAFIRSFFGEKDADEELMAYDSLPREEKQAYQVCVDNEPKLTEELSERCNLDGLPFRLKSPSSLRDKMARKGGSVATFWDVVRYTHVGESDSLMDETKSILGELEENGHTVCEFKNTWNDDKNPYNGINVKMLSPNGQRYELQFHTPESFSLKNHELHELYELSRKLDERKDQTLGDKILKGQLNGRMFELSATLERPKNVSKKVKWEIR